MHTKIHTHTYINIHAAYILYIHINIQKNESEITCYIHTFIHSYIHTSYTYQQQGCYCSSLVCTLAAAAAAAYYYSFSRVFCFSRNGKQVVRSQRKNQHCLYLSGISFQMMLYYEYSSHHEAATYIHTYILFYFFKTNSLCVDLTLS